MRLRTLTEDERRPLVLVPGPPPALLLLPASAEELGGRAADALEAGLPSPTRLGARPEAGDGRRPSPRLAAR